MSRTKIVPRITPRHPHYESYQTRAGWFVVRVNGDIAEPIERFDSAEQCADFLAFLKWTSEAKYRFATH